MKIFLDIGAHTGETLQVALDPVWGFSAIHCVEPAPACVRLLGRYRDARVHVHGVALGTEAGQAVLHGAGALGASLHDDKHSRGESSAATAVTTTVPVLRARDWFVEHVAPDDEVWIKINVEGSECDVLDELLASGRADRVRGLLVWFDVRKVPSQRHREPETRARLDARGVPYVVADDVMPHGGVHELRQWLRDAGARQPVRPSAAARVRHRAGAGLPPSVAARRALSALLPNSAYQFLGRNLGPVGRQRHLARFRGGRPSG